MPLPSGHNTFELRSKFVYIFFELLFIVVVYNFCYRRKWTDGYLVRKWLLRPESNYNSRNRNLNIFWVLLYRSPRSNESIPSSPTLMQRSSWHDSINTEAWLSLFQIKEKTAGYRSSPKFFTKTGPSPLNQHVSVLRRMPIYSLWRFYSHELFIDHVVKNK